MRWIFITLAVFAQPAAADGCDDLKKQMKSTGELGAASIVTSTDLLLLTATTKMSPEASAEIKKIAENLLNAVEDFNKATLSMREASDCF